MPNAIHCPAPATSAGAATTLTFICSAVSKTPIVCEVKGRKSGAGFATLERWLAEFDALFLRRNNADPVVVLPWRVWARIIEAVR